MSISASILHDPTPPPGLAINVVFNPEDYDFEAAHVWLGLVTAGSILAQYPPDQRLLRVENFRTVISNAKFYIIPFRQCTYSTAVWSFWELGTHIARQYPNLARVPTFMSSITTTAGLQAQLDILKPSERAAKLTDVRNATEMESAVRSRDNNSNTSLRASSGRITAEEDPNLSIRYQFLGRRLVPCQVFTAFLRSNTFFSEHDGEELDVSMVAASMDRTVRLGITSVGAGPGADRLIWEFARIAAKAVWWKLVMGYQVEPETMEPRWEAVTFMLEYSGMKIGQGFLS